MAQPPKELRHRSHSPPWAKLGPRSRIVAEDHESAVEGSEWHEKWLQWDQQKSLAAFELGSKLPRAAFLFLEYSGHGLLWLILGALWLFRLYWQGDYEALVVAAKFYAGLIVDIIVVGSLKLIVQRSRPPYNRGHIVATPSADNFSFPSGHSTRAAFTLTFIIANSVGGLTLTLTTAIWTILLSTSRVLMGRHYLSDVIAAMVIGVLEYGLLLLLFWLPTSSDFQWWFGSINDYPVKLPSGEIFRV